jgi:hypothetical protein
MASIDRGVDVASFGAALPRFGPALCGLPTAARDAERRQRTRE